MNKPRSISGAPALLLFSRSAQAEARHKRFASGNRNYTLLQAFIKHARQQAQRSGLPYLQHTEREQVGRTFGEKLRYSMQSVFAQSSQSLIVMGNDCPRLSATTLQRIANDLQKHDIVLGPSQNGGLYFIALRKNAFQASLFEALPWQKRHLQCAIKQYATTLGASLKWYETCNDLNTLNDVRAFTQKYAHHHLSRLWQQLQLPNHSAPLPSLSIFHSRPQLAYHGLRAPPLAA